MARTLGIDPGIAAMGYGLIEGQRETPTALDYGVLSTPPEMATPQRMRTLYLGLMELIERYRPEEVAVELFLARNLRTALVVGQARGVALLAAANSGLPVYEYTPLDIKKAVAGYGRGGKRQLQEMVRIQLGMPSIPQPDDAADALAVALCHSQRSHLARLLGAKA